MHVTDAGKVIVLGTVLQCEIVSTAQIKTIASGLMREDVIRGGDIHHRCVWIDALRKWIPSWRWVVTFGNIV